jgi:hypothetical protein
MKIQALLSLVTLSALYAEEVSPKADTAATLQKHQAGSEVEAEKQDNLAGDVQQLRKEQTQEKVVQLLGEVETLMDESSGNLIEYKTDGETLSAQNEIIEKIFEAAKNKKCNGNCKSSSGMMEMMERMMGKNSEGDEKKPGKKPGDKPGEGMTGESDTANTPNGGIANGEKAIERRIPKASGQDTAGFPEEFQSALDAYNRSAK